MLLSRDHWTSKLITRQAHQCGHSGVAATACGQRFDKDIGYSESKTFLISQVECVFCKKMQAKCETQKMANLPGIRLVPYTPPFRNTACDYFGPYHVKVGRNKSTNHRPYS